jgi:hypothetical protein
MSHDPFAEIARRQREEFARISTAATRAADSLRLDLLTQIDANQAAMRAVLDSEAARLGAIAPGLVASEPLRKAIDETRTAIRKAWERAIPSNLLALDDDLVYAAIEASSESAPCMIWAPQAEIVEQLLQLETFADRRPVLVANRREVLANLEQLVAQAAGHLVKAEPQLYRFASQATAAATAGHDEAAQALTGSALGHLVHEVFGHPTFKAARDKMAARDVDVALLDQLRYYALDRATARVIAHTNEGLDGFNRHGTLHGMAAYFGEAEMLTGLLLLVAWTRELAWWAEHEPDAFGD